MNKMIIGGYKLKIRSAKQKDLKALEWDGEYQHFRNVFKQTYQLTKTGNTQMWVIEEDREGIIGQVFIQLNGHRKKFANGYDRVYLYSIRIKPDFRNLGIGTYLMETIQSRMENHGTRYFTLNVAKENTQALRFYKRLGYEIQGHDDGKWSYIDHLGNKRNIAEPSWRMELDNYRDRS